MHRPSFRSVLRLPGLVVAAAALLVSCSPKEPENQGGLPPGTPGAPGTGGGKRLSIQIVTNGISPFWDPMAAGMERTAAKLGCQANWKGPQTAQIADQKRM